MDLAQTGQLGAAIEELVSEEDGGSELIVATLVDVPALAWRISPYNAGPSISLTLRPLAKLVASSVNRPEVTTNPPVAPLAAITP